MSFPRMRESSKAYKNKFLYAYFYQICTNTKIIFWIPAFAGMTPDPHR
ncbi:hypothetical protein [Rickettsia endosymbiont of Aspidapion aeneum]